MKVPGITVKRSKEYYGKYSSIVTIDRSCQLLSVTALTLPSLAN